MLGPNWGSLRCCAFVLALFPIISFAAQSPDRVTEIFEGRTVVLKMDMPGTQQGVDIYPQRSQPLEIKSYSNRLKQYGASLHSGDSAIVTKVKVKDDVVEFQLAGGGYGASGDDTDTSMHFTPSSKSGREKDLEGQVKTEKDPERKRSLQRALDSIRDDRERRDRHDRELAERAAEDKKQWVMSRRMQGGSRFNVRLETKKTGETITSDMVSTALSPYVSFPSNTQSSAPLAAYPIKNQAVTQTAPPPAGNHAFSLRKGLTREQVEGMYGPPSDVQENEQNGLKIVACTYSSGDSIVKADFVNGVLVQYNVTSR